MSVFMARGYKDPFHKHVSQSLANYFSQQTKDEIRSVLESSGVSIEDDLLSLLDDETVTAWGAQSGLNHDRDLFEEMAPGDWFLMRTARPEEIKYVQQVDLLLGEDVPREVREQISEVIWGAPDYDLLCPAGPPRTPIGTTPPTRQRSPARVRRGRTAPRRSRVRRSVRGWWTTPSFPYFVPPVVRMCGGCGRSDLVTRPAPVTSGEATAAR